MLTMLRKLIRNFKATLDCGQDEHFINVQNNTNQNVEII